MADVKTETGGGPLSKCGGVGVNREALHRELTIQRRLWEHSREQAKRDLAYAQKQINRITDEYLKYFGDRS